MATRKIVPRADNEGGIGTALKQWASGWIKLLTVTTINALTLAAASVGFTVAGGTTSKTLTVDETVTLSNKANVGAEKIKIWTYTHTITSGEETAQSVTLTITAVTLANVRGFVYCSFVAGRVRDAESGVGNYVKTGYFNDTTTVMFSLGTSMVAGTILSLTIFEAV